MARSPKQIMDLPIEPGVYTEQTARGAATRWKDADKVRFRKGLPEKIGGWVRIIETQLIGLARRIWDWASLDAQNWAAIGSEQKLYLFNSNILYDITPVRRTATLSNPFTTTISSDSVSVEDIGHGASAGDFVRFTGATPVGGIAIDGEYQIQSITDADNYLITDNQTATSSATGGGTPQAQYDIPIGEASTGFGTGYNTGTYDQETYNTPRTSSNFISRLRTWSLDNWGEDLIANPRRGGIYWWDRTNGAAARAVQLTEAPERCNFVIISQRDRHMFALGCTDLFTDVFDPLLIRWCSKEDFTDWVPTSTNTAGDLRLYRGSEIVTAVRTRGEIIVFTDVSLHQINFLGGQAVFGLSPAGENVSILGPNAAIAVDSRVFFMAEGDFYIYDGVLKVLPCDVRNLVYSSLNIFQKDKVFCGLNREFNEVWWFYPGSDPDVWFEDNFSTGALSASYGIQSMDVSDKYTVSFNAAGYVEATQEATSSVYDWMYLGQISAQARIDSPLDWDLEATVTLVSTTAGITWTGPAIHTTDLSGNENTAGDNLDGIFVEVDLSTNFGRISKRSLGNPSTLVQLNLNTLPTAVTLTAGQTYGLTITRTATEILATIYDPVTDTKQQFAAHTLTAQELLDFAGPGYGFSFADENASAIFDPSSINRLLSIRGAPGGVLTAQAGTGSTDEVNRYVAYNYEENTWVPGSMERTAWRDRGPLFEKPFAVATDGYLYEHETGTDENGVAMNAYAETYDMEIPEAGEYLAHVDQLIPDFLELDGSVDLTLSGKKYPQQAEYQVKGPYQVTPGTTRISTRFRARQAALRIESDAIGDRWRMGTLRMRVRAHGKR